MGELANNLEIILKTNLVANIAIVYLLRLF